MQCFDTFVLLDWYDTTTNSALTLHIVILLNFQLNNI